MTRYDDKVTGNPVFFASFSCILQRLSSWTGLKLNDKRRTAYPDRAGESPVKVKPKSFWNFHLDTASSTEGINRRFKGAHSNNIAGSVYENRGVHLPTDTVLLRLFWIRWRDSFDCKILVTAANWSTDLQRMIAIEVALSIW